MEQPIAPDSPEAIRSANLGDPLPIDFAGECRIVVRSAMMLMVLIVIIPLHYLFRWVKYGSPFAMLFLRLACRIVGGRVKIHGVPLRRDVFFISNHVSWLDVPAIGGANGSTFVARSELKKTRALGWLAGMNRTVFTQRSEKLNIAAQINDLREAMADNWSITIFAEGTVTDGHSLLPFKTSFLRVLEPPPPGVLVQPLVIDYGPLAEWIAWLNMENGIDNARRIFARRGNFPINLHFLDPFDPHDFPGRKAVAAEARRQIETCLTGKLGKPLRPYRFDVASVGYVAPATDGLNPA
jgi:1-acyl-sn-glycerol-3-phosphate acyltransferase